MGVRISWLMLARNSLLERLAASADASACINSASTLFCSLTSVCVPTMRRGESWASNTAWPRDSTHR